MGNKRVGILVALLALVLVFGFSVLSFAYSGGDGSLGDPFQIDTPGDLIELSNSSGDWGDHFIQTSDIVFNSNEVQVDWDNSGSSGPTEGFSPIGKDDNSYFNGSYDGQNHTIDNLYINRSSENYIGLFGYTDGATIKNVGLVSANVNGVANSDIHVGGLVGANFGEEVGSVRKSFVKGSVYGESSSGDADVGGLVGEKYGDVSNSYARASVDGSAGGAGSWGYFGGLVGHFGDDNVSNSYAAGSVDGSAGDTANLGGLVGSHDFGSVTASFWDTETSGLNSSAGGTGKIAEEMQGACTFIDAGWNFAPSDETGSSADGIWTIDEGSSNANSGYPALAWEGLTNDYESCNTPPSADASNSETPIDEGASLDLNGSASSDDDGDSLNYDWDLDNDETYGDVTGETKTVDWSTLKNYGINDDGSYTIELEVNDGTATDTTTYTLTVENVAPTDPTDLSFDPSSPKVDDSLTANASGSTDVDADTITYEYKFYNETDSTELQTWGTDNTYTIQVADAHDTIRVETKATDNEGETFGEYSKTVDVANTDPVADTQGSETPIDEGASLDLVGSVSSDDDEDSLDYSWDLNYDETSFAEDVTGTAPTVDWSTLESYGINDDGTYTIGLKVSDGYGGTDTTTYELKVDNVPPTAHFEYSPSNPIIGEEIEFSASGSSDPVDSISYSWDWTDDGDYDTSTTSDTTAHTYTDPGTYTVKLEVEDDNGDTDTTTKEVEVKIGAVDEISVVASSQVLPTGAEAAAGTSSATSSSSGEASTTLTATAKNSVDYPVRDATVNFSTQYGTLSSSSAVTDISGKASVTLTAPNEPSTSTIKAAAEGKPAATSVYFQEEGGPAVLGSKSTVLISGQRSASIDAKAQIGDEVEIRKKEEAVDEEVAVTVAEFSDNPRDKKALNVGPGGYLAANVDKPEKLERMTLKIHLDPWPNEPRVKFWDETERTWVTIEDNAEAFPNKGYIKVTIGPNTEPDLSSLSGLKLAAGGLDVEYIQVKNSGWAMVSPPLDPEKGDYSDPTYVFKDLDTSTIYHWNPGKRAYRTPEDGYKLAPFSGNWIWIADTDVPKAFKVAGVYEGNVTITLENTGWHQVGIPLDYGWSNIGVTKEGKDTMTVAAQAAGPSSPHWMSRFIWAYGTEAETYTAYDASNSTDFNLKPGKAYWVKTYEEDVKLVIPYNAPPPTPTEASVQAKGIPMNSARADKLNVPNPPNPPETYSVGQFDIQVTPNPVTNNDQVTFIAAGSDVQSFKVTVFNSSGKQIYASPRQSDHTYTWKPEGNLSNGLYLYQVTAQKSTGKTLAEVGKLLVLK